MPVVEHYRGVPVHGWQPAERIAQTVRPAIDAVFAIGGGQELASYAADARHPPEARLLAAARCEAAWQLAAEGRATRPDIDRARLRASVGGLTTRKWVSLSHYGSLFDMRLSAPVPREAPLTEADLGA